MGAELPRGWSWGELPATVFLAIGSYLSTSSIISARQACRSWRDGLAEAVDKLLLDSQNLDAEHLSLFKKIIERVFPKAHSLTLDVGCSLSLTEEQAAQHEAVLQDIFGSLAASPQVTHLTIIPAQLLKYSVAQRVYRALAGGLCALPAPLRSLSLDITAMPEAGALPQPVAWMALTELRILDASWQHGKICRTSPLKPQHITLLAALTNLRSLQLSIPRATPARPPHEPGISLEQVNASVASLAALTNLQELHVRGYGNPNYNGLQACLPMLARLRSLKLQHAEPGLSGLQGLFIENPTPFSLDCLRRLQLLTRLEVQAATEVTLADWGVLSSLPLLQVLHLQPVNLMQVAWQQAQQEHAMGLQQEQEQQQQEGGQEQGEQAQAHQAAPLELGAAELPGSGSFPALQELAVTMPAGQLHHLVALTSLTSLTLTCSDRATAHTLGSLVEQLSPLQQLRSLHLLHKPSLPSLLRLGTSCLGKLAQVWPGLQQLTLQLQAPRPPPEAWQPLQRLVQLQRLNLCNTSPQPAHICPSQLPAGLLELRLFNISLAAGSIPLAQALPELQQLSLCTGGEEWDAEPVCQLAVGSRLQALELDQVSLSPAALQRLLGEAAGQLTRLELVNRHEWSKQAGAVEALCCLSRLSRLCSLRLILDSQDRAANWFPPALMSCLLALGGLRSLVLGLGPRFTYDHGLWQGSRTFTQLVGLSSLRRLDIHELSSDVRAAFQAGAPHCRFNHHQYFRAE